MLELLLTMAEEFCWRREVSSGYSTYDKSLLLLKTFKDDFDLYNIANQMNFIENYSKH